MSGGAEDELYQESLCTGGGASPADGVSGRYTKSYLSILRVCVVGNIFSENESPASQTVVQESVPCA